MAVTRLARLGDALVFHRRFEHHALGELIDHAALDFLPWGLAWRIACIAVLGERGTAFRKLLPGDHDVGSAFAQIDADAVAGPDERKPAVRRGLRRGIEDRRRTRGAGLAAVADAGKRIDAL